MNQEKPPFKTGAFIFLLIGTYFIPLIGIIVGAMNMKSPNRNGQSCALVGFGVIMFLWAFLGGLAVVDRLGGISAGGGSNPEPRQAMVACEFCRGNGVCVYCSGSGQNPYGGSFCYSCGGNGVCDYCEGEGRYPENMDLAADAFNYVTKKGPCNACRATGKCFGCRGVERPAWLGPCIVCRGTNVCSLCQGKKYLDVRDRGVKARE